MTDTLDLLGGARRGRTRPRGFIDWNPRPETLALIDTVRLILVEYTAYLPLTIRQIFYRLVSAYGYEKTELAYGRLGEHLNRARRAHMIPMSAIRDDGGSEAAPYTHEDFADYKRTARRIADTFRLDRSAGQPSRLMVWCEAAGMIPQLGTVANPFGVEARSSSGFESVSEKHALAAEIAREGRPVEILHIGDHDPSGVHMPLSLEEDLAAFCQELGGEFTLTRLAVTPAQIAEYRLPTAPAKATDPRAFRGRTVQAEALAPDVMATILRSAIESRLDADLYAATLEIEAAERAEAMQWARHR